ncbi:MAG: hypothetical protein ACJ8BF_10970 [Gemmatimonadales bacterium]
MAERRSHGTGMLKTGPVPADQALRRLMMDRGSGRTRRGWICGWDVLEVDPGGGREANGNDLEW